MRLVFKPWLHHWLKLLLICAGEVHPSVKKERRLHKEDLDRMVAFLSRYNTVTSQCCIMNVDGLVPLVRIIFIIL